MGPMKIYLRIAEHPEGRDAPFKVAASTKRNDIPLKVGQGYSERFLPTVMFAIELEIPDSMMNQAERILAQIEIPEKAVEVAAAVGYPEED